MSSSPTYTVVDQFDEDEFPDSDRPSGGSTPGPHLRSTLRPADRAGPPQFPSSLSERSTPHTPEGSWRLQFQDLHRVHGLHRDYSGSAPSAPTLRAGPLTTLQASLHAADRPVAPPKGLSTLGFDPDRFQPEPPVCYRAS